MATYRFQIKSSDECRDLYKDLIIVVNAREDQKEEVIKRVAEIYFNESISSDDSIKRMLLKEKSELDETDNEIIAKDKERLACLERWFAEELPKSIVREGTIQTYTIYKNGVRSDGCSFVDGNPHSLNDTYFDLFLR